MTSHHNTTTPSKDEHLIKLIKTDIYIIITHHKSANVSQRLCLNKIFKKVHEIFVSNIKHCLYDIIDVAEVKVNMC